METLVVGPLSSRYTNINAMNKKKKKDIQDPQKMKDISLTFHDDVLKTQD